MFDRHVRFVWVVIMNQCIWQSVHICSKSESPEHLFSSHSFSSKEKMSNSPISP